MSWVEASHEVLRLKHARVVDSRSGQLCPGRIGALLDPLGAYALLEAHRKVKAGNRLAFEELPVTLAVGLACFLLDDEKG